MHSRPLARNSLAKKVGRALFVRLNKFKHKKPTGEGPFSRFTYIYIKTILCVKKRVDETKKPTECEAPLVDGKKTESTCYSPVSGTGEVRKPRSYPFS